ncbi:MAG: alpha-2-macroglobulin, partial [Acidobacteriota bacterium]|nr:alpha-2-macroglobulin [Acidobacteriota bacterium]
LTDEESDAVELTVPVHPHGVKLTESRAGSLSGANNQAAFALKFPSQIVAESRGLEISVSPSIAGALFGAVDYLTEFPYGCTEQTMSSFLPNVVVSRALRDLGVKSDVNPAVLAKKLRAGMDRLYDFQHEDGGWGWWKTDDSALFMTAYVVAGLSQAKAAGQDIENERIERASKWLRAAYDKEPRMLADLKSYAVYALAFAGKSDAKIIDDVWQRKDKMSPYGLALLGLALEMVKDRRAGEVAGQLESAAKSSDSEAWWPAERDDLMDIYSDATPESTAYALKLLVHLRPQSALLEKAAVWLMNHRREGSYWYSTKQTAMVIYGLTDYLKATAELKPNFNATVSVNGKTVLTHSFRAADALAPASPKLRIAAADLAAETNEIRVERAGEGRLYWSVRQEYYSTEQKFVKTGSTELNLLRDYFKLTPGKDGEKIVYKLDPLQGALAVGDVVAVRLTVTGGDWKYLLVEDPIPSGAEFIERDDLYQMKEAPSWWRSYYTRREFHDDHAALFQTYFSSGQQQYFYLLKIVNPGQFRVSPARVQPMYQPNYLSTSESKLIEVR